jgi:hypothetical protein
MGAMASQLLPTCDFWHTECCCPGPAVGLKLTAPARAAELEFTFKAPYGPHTCEKYPYGISTQFLMLTQWNCTQAARTIMTHACVEVALSFPCSWRRARLDPIAATGCSKHADVAMVGGGHMQRWFASLPLLDMGGLAADVCSGIGACRRHMYGFARQHNFGLHALGVAAPWPCHSGGLAVTPYACGTG